MFEDNIRRVQQPKKDATLLVSIPKYWSERIHLHKGDYVSCTPTKGKGTALVIRKLQQGGEGGDQDG